MEPGRGRDTQSLPQGDAQMGEEGGGATHTFTFQNQDQPEVQVSGSQFSLLIIYLLDR